MRRKDREVTEHDKIVKIISECNCCRLAFPEENGAYVVPMNFGLREENGKLFLYFHSAEEGRKIEFLKKSPYVGFEMDVMGSVVGGEKACSYTCNFASIIGHGRVDFLESASEKIDGLNALMDHYEPGKTWNYDEKYISHMAVLKMEVLDMTCKAHG